MNSLHWIEATQKTLLKKQPIDSTKLDASLVMPVEKDRRFPVNKWEQSDSGHYKVILGEKAGTWYIFDAADNDGDPGHWLCSWEDESTEQREHSPFITTAQKNKPTRISPQSSFTDRFTANFTFGELCRYQKQRRPQYQHQCDTALFLCEFLEKVRAEVQSPIQITSGFRPRKVNRAVGGAIRSEHLYDAPMRGAIDFNVPRWSKRQLIELEKWCDRQWPYSLGYGASYRGFIHIGVRSANGGKTTPRFRWHY